MSCLLSIAPEIRMSLYRDFLGNRSMSIAVLRQTCPKICGEIESAMQLARYKEGRVPIFDHSIDVQKLDGCSLATIESCLPSIATRNLDVSTWDFLFANAVDSCNWNDIDRLLDMFIYPLSSVLRCDHIETRLRVTMERTGVLSKVTRPTLDLFVAMVASQDKEAIQKYYHKLPCECVKSNFVYSAIKQALFVVLDALSLNVADLNISTLARVVGESGSIEMLHYVYDRLDFNNHPGFCAHFLNDCFSNAACSNHINLLKHVFCLHGSIKLQLGTWSSKYYSDDAVEFIMDQITPVNWSTNCLMDAARFGNASVFGRLIALQLDPSCTEWHSKFAYVGNKMIPLSLYNALMRSAEDMTYFCSLYAEIMPTTLLEPVTPSFGRGPGKTMWSAILDQSKSRLSAAQMTVLLNHMLMFLNANPHNLLVDCLEFVLKADKFRVDLAEAIMQKLSPSLEHAPLTESECKSFAKLAVDDDAFDWVCDHFNVTITPKEATAVICGASSMRPNVWHRWISLGAQIEHGIYLLADLMWLRHHVDDYHPPENVDHKHLQRLCKLLIITGDIKTFRKIFRAGCRGDAWANVMLELLEMECKRCLLCRDRDTGCLLLRFDDTLPIRDSTHPLSSRGYMRLYYEACEWFNITPLNPSNIPFAMNAESNKQE